MPLVNSLCPSCGRGGPANTISERGPDVKILEEPYPLWHTLDDRAPAKLLQEGNARWEV